MDTSTPPDATLENPVVAPVEPEVITPVDETPVETKETPQAEPVQTEREKLLAGIDSVLKPAAEAPVEEAAKVAEVAPTAEKTVADKPAPVAPVEDDGKDDDKLEFKEHPRFKALRDEAYAARQFRKEADTKIAEANANLVPLTNLRSFLADSGVTGEEFSTGLQIMRALKNDPILASKLLEPHLTALNGHTGKGELPPDLKEKVTSGEVSEEFAREMVRQRTATTVAKQNAERVVQQTTQADSARLAQDAQTAVMAWEQNLMATDPDYGRKQELVVRLIQAEATKSPPRTPQEAINLANVAYNEATRLLPKAAPLPKPATKPAPSTASSSQGRTVVTTKPKNLREGVDQVLAGLRS